MKKILIAGSSGMIGQLILHNALEAQNIKEVVSLVRTPSSIQHPKLKEVVIEDFLDYHSQQALFDQVEVVIIVWEYIQALLIGIYFVVLPSIIPMH